MHDVDLDGCQDLVVTAPVGPHPAAVPAGLPQQRQRAVLAGTPPRRFVLDGDEHFGWGAMPIDANGDGAIDFVVSELGPGRDGIWETADDPTWLVTIRPAETAPGRPSPFPVGQAEHRPGAVDRRRRLIRRGH